MSKRDNAKKGLLLGYLFWPVAIGVVEILELIKCISSEAAFIMDIIIVAIFLVAVIGVIIFYVISYCKKGLNNINSCGEPVFCEIDWYREHWGETEEHYEHIVNVIHFYYKSGGKVDKYVGNNLMKLYRRLDYLNTLISTKDYLSNCMMSIGISFATSLIVSNCLGSEETIILRTIFIILSLVGIFCVMLFPHNAMMKSGNCSVYEYERKLLLKKIEIAEESVLIEGIDEDDLKRRQNILKALMKQNKRAHGKRSEELDEAIREVEKLNFHKHGKISEVNSEEDDSKV